MDEITYTHKGWFGLCPVYISEPHSDEPSIEPRYLCTDWLLALSAWIWSWDFSFVEGDDKALPIRVTGELEDPFVVEYER